MFKIEHIEYLYLLIGLPILSLLFYGLLFWRNKQMSKLGKKHMIQRLVPEYSRLWTWVRHGLWIAGLTCLILAWANPQFGGRKEKAKAKQSDIFIALDISQSMNAEDISPSRLERTKRFCNTLVEALRGERIGLIFFAGGAYLQMPLTADYAASNLFISAANTDQAGTQGTSFAEAINLSMDAFEPEVDHQRALIILSDGEDHEEEAIAAAEKAATDNIVIFTIAVGTEEGAFIPVNSNGAERFLVDESGVIVRSSVNLPFMADLAATTGGKFYSVDRGQEVIDDIKLQISRLQKKEVEQKSFTDFTSYYQYILGLGLLFLLLEYLIPRKKKSIA